MRHTQRSVFAFGVLSGLAAVVLFALVILAGVGVQTLRDEHAARSAACAESVFSGC